MFSVVSKCLYKQLASRMVREGKPSKTLRVAQKRMPIITWKRSPSSCFGRWGWVRPSASVCVCVCFRVPSFGLA